MATVIKRKTLSEPTFACRLGERFEKNSTFDTSEQLTYILVQDGKMIGSTTGKTQYGNKEVKLNKCQVLKNVTDEDAAIEMHHGPIFTLFDICCIVLEYFIKKKWKISTFRIADAVLDEHQKNRVQVVMVSVTVHEEIHNGEVFINRNQAYGDIAAFIKKYKDAMSDEFREQVNRYIDRSLLYDSTDFGVLELSKDLLKE